MDALFVGWEDQDNLGLRYIMSYLGANGYETALVPYSPDAEQRVFRAALEHNPNIEAAQAAYDVRRICLPLGAGPLMWVMTSAAEAAIRRTERTPRPAASAFGRDE